MKYTVTWIQIYVLIGIFSKFHRFYSYNQRNNRTIVLKKFKLCYAILTFTYIYNIHKKTIQINILFCVLDYFLGNLWCNIYQKIKENLIMQKTTFHSLTIIP